MVRSATASRSLEDLLSCNLDTIGTKTSSGSQMEFGQEYGTCPGLDQTSRSPNAFYSFDIFENVASQFGNEACEG
eukprot:scaffold5296_cov163-Amphora_coffeaeformis.AAC.15